MMAFLRSSVAYKSTRRACYTLTYLLSNVCNGRRGGYIKLFCYAIICIFLTKLFYANFLSRYFQSPSVISPCTFPGVNFYDKSLEKLFYKYPTPKCDYWEDLVYFDKEGVLRINHTAVTRSGHSDVNCGYSGVEMLDQNKVIVSDNYIYNVPAYTESDFVHVKCKDINGMVIYSNLHYKVDRKPTLSKRKIGEESLDHLSVLIYGLDSVSNLVAERKLQLTLPYIRDDLGAYVFNGYTKVGENTLPNLLAMLLGKTIPELAVPSFFDYPAVYKEVLAGGYADCYSEDWSITWPYLGFKYPYYTHYIRKLFLAKEVEKVDIFMKDSAGKILNTSTSRLCFTNKLQHQVLLDYCKKCFEAYEKKLKYIFMWQNEISHSEPNCLSVADKDLRNFLKWMKDTNRLETTVVILVADHGPRIGPLLQNDISRLTARMPMLAMIIPDHIKKRYPHMHENLLWNTQRLTTHFDLHETLLDILRKNFVAKEIGGYFGSLPRGISLFQRIPKHRSCFDAGVSEHYCPCYSYSDASIQNEITTKVAHFMLTTINDFLLKYKGKCAELQISRLISAKIQHAPKDKNNSRKSVRYVIVFQTTPGAALFEATAERFSDTAEVKMLGDFNRLNKYGNQSSCIYDPIKYAYLFCYCV